MSENQAPQMSDDFIKLCQTISLGEDKDLYQKRWTGVLAIIKEINPQDIETVIRVVFRSKQPPDKETLNRIRQRFKVADDLFLLSGNDPELELMCAAILINLFERMGKNASLAALAVTTTAMNGARKPAVSIDLVGRAEESLNKNARSVRQRPDMGKLLSVAAPKLNFTDVISKVPNPIETTGVIAALNSVSEVIQKNINGIHTQSSKIMSELNRYIAVQDEELQILWWLVGGQSWSKNQPFSEVAANSRPIIFAKELADFTRVYPGPEGIRGILSRTGLQNDIEITIPDALNACDKEWLSLLLNDASPSAVTLPIHSAIARKIETGDSESWIPGWIASAGLPKKTKLSMLTLGELFYRERLQII